MQTRGTGTWRRKRMAGGGSNERKDHLLMGSGSGWEELWAHSSGPTHRKDWRERQTEKNRKTER